MLVPDSIASDSATLVDPAVAYKTVSTFSGITQRALFLKNGEYSKTDGHVITVSFGDKNYYQKLEHEIAHILFRSDYTAKKLFISEYLDVVTNHSKTIGIEVRESRIRFLLSSIIGLLEDHRVNGLWGRLYPGSRDTFRELAHDRALELVPKAHSSFLYFMVCIYADCDVPEGPLSQFTPTIRTAFEKVAGRGFDATLVTAKWLVIQAVNVLVEASRLLPMSGNTLEGGTLTERLEGLQLLSGALLSENQDELTELERIFEDLEDLVAPKFVDLGVQTAAAVQRYLRIDPNNSEDFSSFLENSKSVTEQLVSETKQRLRDPFRHDDWLQQDATSKIIFQDVTRSDIEEPSEPLCSSDLETVRRIRTTFQRVMGRRALELRDTGTSIDVASYIERRLTGEPIPCFKSEAIGPGFRCLILLDRSSSMQREKTTQAERACRILTRALKYPFVEFEVWGFQSWNGDVIITRFENGLESFTSEKSIVVGHTPLHLAIQVAARHLEATAATKQLVVITDGVPIFGSKKDFVTIDDRLISATGSEVKAARTKGIQVTGLVIDKDAKPSQLFRMFGSNKNWNYLERECIGTGIVKTVTGTFLSYLRHA